MKNVLLIDTEGEKLVSSTHDTTNRLFINNSEIDSSNWVGSGNYTATVEGHAITIKKAPDLNGNYQLVKVGSYSYEFTKVKSEYEQLLDLFYPVGSYYETSDNSFNPNNSWGGTWIAQESRLNAEDKKLLWTNPNPSSSFVSQTISMNLSVYDHVEVWFVGVNNTVDAFVPNPVNVKIGDKGFIVLFHDLGADNIVNENTGSRYMTTTTSSIFISDYAYKNRRTNGVLTKANQFCIPQKIYGVTQRTNYRWHRTA